MNSKKVMGWFLAVLLIQALLHLFRSWLNVYYTSLRECWVRPASSPNLRLAQYALRWMHTGRLVLTFSLLDFTRHCQLKKRSNMTIPLLQRKRKGSLFCPLLGRRRRPPTPCTDGGTTAPLLLHEEIFIKANTHTQSQGFLKQEKLEVLLQTWKGYPNRFTYWPSLSDYFKKHSKPGNRILNYQNISLSNS